MAKAKPLQLSVEERNQLESIARSRTLQAQVVTRARILLLKAGTESVDTIAEKVGLAIPLVRDTHKSENFIDFLKYWMPSILRMTRYD